MFSYDGGVRFNYLLTKTGIRRSRVISECWSIHKKWAVSKPAGILAGRNDRRLGTALIRRQPQCVCRGPGWRRRGRREEAAQRSKSEPTHQDATQIWGTVHKEPVSSFYRLGFRCPALFFGLSLRQLAVRGAAVAKPWFTRDSLGELTHPKAASDFAQTSGHHIPGCQCPHLACRLSSTCILLVCWCGSQAGSWKLALPLLQRVNFHHRHTGGVAFAAHNRGILARR
jgi:hypothetical protein